ADTHALIWWFTGSPKLSPVVVEIFERSESGNAVIFIPSIVIAEALSIFDKKRVIFDFKQLFKSINESENFIIVPLDFPILKKMVSLKDIPELHDKIIVATAKYLNQPLITKDAVLHTIAALKTVW
ncbi:MAG: PIN domain-containing protein, partial [Syntrophales bacterium LBB04]|nr:PIN domain-containing protein [Syntrophales bacterium LBB04]